MSFAAPWLLAGLVAAAIPWLVHLIGKRRAVPVRFAAMQLLLRSERRVSARRRLREVLLLLSRTAAAALLVLVFARPFTERIADLPAASLEPQSAVILLDDSASLRRTRGRETLFDEARARARTLAQQFPSDSDLALVLASEGSNAPVAELTAERSRILQGLEGTRPSARPADFRSAMERASSILGASSRSKRRIFVVTDLQATGWEQGTGLSAKDPPEVLVVDVTGETPWENRAVVDVRAEPAAEAGPGGVTVIAEIADHSARGVAGLSVALRIDGEVRTKSLVDLPAGGRVTKRFLHTFPPGSGSAHDLVVEIDSDDAFRLDDRRRVHLELARTLRALVINGDARTADKEDEPYFLEQALRAGDRGGSITVVLPDEVAVEGLAGYTAVFFLNVAQPSAALAAALTRFVEGGGGLFLSVGARVDPSSWNERFGRLLPQPLAVERTASALPGQRTGEIVDDRPAERLAPIDRRHPILASFPPQGEGLASARFFKYVLLEPVPDTAGRTVILRYESGAPALVERQVGRGRVLLLSTTVDREWTDLPIRPGFLPLVRESARRLVGASDEQESVALLVGQPREIAVASEDRRVEISKPDGSVWSIEPREAPAGALGPPAARPASGAIAFTDTDEPGIYRVRVAGADGTLTPRPSDTFVVNLDPRESDPGRLAPERRPDQAGKATSGAPVAKRKVELWHGLAAALIAFVFLESLLTVRWRRSVLVAQR